MEFEVWKENQLSIVVLRKKYKEVLKDNVKYYKHTRHDLTMKKIREIFQNTDVKNMLKSFLVPRDPREIFSKTNVLLVTEEHRKNLRMLWHNLHDPVIYQLYIEKLGKSIS